MGGYQEMTRQSLIHLENIAYLPYRDIAGVLTVCVGHTGPDIEMRRYSHAECMALLDSDLKPVYAAIDRLVRVPLTPYQKTALATFIFNTGVTAFSKSTLLKNSMPVITPERVTRWPAGCLPQAINGKD